MFGIRGNSVREEGETGDYFVRVLSREFLILGGSNKFQLDRISFEIRIVISIMVSIRHFSMRLSY